MVSTYAFNKAVLNPDGVAVDRDTAVVGLLTNPTLTAAQVISNDVFSISGGAGHTVTTPTAALLVAAMTDPRVGDVVEMTIHSAIAADTIAVNGGTGVTLVGAADLTAQVGVTLVFRLTNVTAAAEAATCYLL